MTQPRHKLLRSNAERVADAQQREYGARPSGLDHLPVTQAETVTNHVFLAQFALRPVCPDAMAQGAEETRVTGR